MPENKTGKDGKDVTKKDPTTKDGATDPNEGPPHRQVETINL